MTTLDYDKMMHLINTTKPGQSQIYFEGFLGKYEYHYNHDNFVTACQHLARHGRAFFTQKRLGSLHSLYIVTKPKG